MKYIFYINGSRSLDQIYTDTLYVPRTTMVNHEPNCKGLSCRSCVCGRFNGHSLSCYTFKTTDTELSAKDLVERELVKQLLE